MDEMYDLKKARNQYYELLDNLQSVVKCINECAEPLQTAQRDININYKINNNSATKKFNELSDSLLDEKRELLRIIATINKNISILQDKIQMLETGLAEI